MGWGVCGPGAGCEGRGKGGQGRAVNADITALKRSGAQLAHQARHAPLTGLANRALPAENLERSLARRTVDGAKPALLFIDLDQFKQVNDTLGHPCGDQLLCAVAERLRDMLRPEDFVARFGGDDFVVFQQDIKSNEDADGLPRLILSRRSERTVG